MTLPKVETVNVVTMEHGQKFVQQLFGGADVSDACDETEILKWPGDDDDADPTDDETESFHLLTNDICRRLRAAIGDRIAETFVRVANAAIDAERLADDTELTPPRVQTVRVVTVEHGEMYVDDVHRHMIDTGGFAEAFCRTHVMTWPGDDVKDAQQHFGEMEDEIRDRLFEETRPVIVEAFVRIASDVTLRERRRR